RFGTINGVIHGAGTTTADAFCAISQADRRLSERHFRPKAQGLCVLEEVLRGQEVDFWALLSSLSAVLGGLGFIAYSAANSFMDAFASKQNQSGSAPWLTINWDGWEFRENLRVGPAAESAVLPHEGVEAFRRILSQTSIRQVVVSVGDLAARINQWIKLEALQESQHSTAGAELHTRPTLATQYVVPRNQLEQTVAEIWQELLGVRQVGVYDNFFELGGHSLIAIQIISRLRAALRADISVHTLFDAPTVAQLVESIEHNSPARPEELDKITQILGLCGQL